MFLRLIRLVLQLVISGVLFLPIMHQKDDESILFNGFEAIIKGDYLIIGNIVMALVMLGIIIHLMGIIYELISKKHQKFEGTINMVVNITLILGVIWVTFLGTFLELFGYLVLSLLIASTYLRYLQQKQEE
jgi:hypothetical protein